MSCPRCNSSNIIGNAGGSARHTRLCRHCGYSWHVPVPPRPSPPERADLLAPWLRAFGVPNDDT